jgi:hypothetical protein
MIDYHTKTNLCLVTWDFFFFWPTGRHKLKCELYLSQGTLFKILIIQYQLNSVRTVENFKDKMGGGFDLACSCEYRNYHN